MSEYIPAGGSVEVLLTQIRVIDRSTPSEWLDADGASLERAQRNIKAHRELGFKLQYEIRELVDIAHVTRLTADNARLRAEARDLRILSDDQRLNLKRKTREYIAMKGERDALQSENANLLADLTKALELLTEHEWQWQPYDETYHRESGYRCPDCGAYKEQGHTKTCETGVFLAHQSAPAAKSSLVECDACPTSGGCVETCMKAPAAKDGK